MHLGRELMSNDDLRNTLSEYYDEETLDEIVLFENPDYADAVVGVSHDDRVIYSYDKMIEHLMQVDGMTEEEAAEFIDFNTLRALPYASSYGANTPIIMYDLGIEKK